MHICIGVSVFFLAICLLSFSFWAADPKDVKGYTSSRITSTGKGKGVLLRYQSSGLLKSYDEAFYQINCTLPCDVVIFNQRTSEVGLVLRGGVTYSGFVDPVYPPAMVFTKSKSKGNATEIAKLWSGDIQIELVAHDVRLYMSVFNIIMGIVGSVVLGVWVSCISHDIILHVRKRRVLSALANGMDDGDDMSEDGDDDISEDDASEESVD